MLFALTCLGPPQVLESQATVQLRPAGAYPEPFTFLSEVRELADGRVVVADPIGQVLVRLDFIAGTADTVGRVGEGPGEYRQPDAVFPLPGDSTLLVDLGNARLSAVSADGSFGETWPIGMQTRSGDHAVVLPRFVDAAGRIYMEGSRYRDGVFADSASIMRFDRANQDFRSVGWLLQPRIERAQVGNEVLEKVGPLQPGDDWAVAPDGRVAIVRATDYSVEWSGAGGRPIRGPAVPWQPIPVSRADKELWAAEAAANQMSSVAAVGPEGVRNERFFRGGFGAASPGIDLYEWPDALPPFRKGRSRVAPSGVLWVERYVSAGSAPIIDRFDEEGSFMGQVSLPPRTRVVGFGQDHVYLARTDDVDFQWLERYRLPPRARE